MSAHVPEAHTPVYAGMRVYEACTLICLRVVGHVCTSVCGAMSVLEVVKRGSPRFVPQATLISCVTSGKLLHFSEPKIPAL